MCTLTSCLSAFAMSVLIAVMLYLRSQPVPMHSSDVIAMLLYMPAITNH